MSSSGYASYSNKLFAVINNILFDSVSIRTKQNETKQKIDILFSLYLVVRFDLIFFFFFVRSDSAVVCSCSCFILISCRSLLLLFLFFSFFCFYFSSFLLFHSRKKKKILQRFSTLFILCGVL